MVCSRSSSAVGLGLEKSVAEQACGGEAVGVPFLFVLVNLHASEVGVVAVLGGMAAVTNSGL